MGHSKRPNLSLMMTYSRIGMCKCGSFLVQLAKTCTRHIIAGRHSFFLQAYRLFFVCVHFNASVILPSPSSLSLSPSAAHCLPSELGLSLVRAQVLACKLDFHRFKHFCIQILDLERASEKYSIQSYRYYFGGGLGIYDSVWATEQLEVQQYDRSLLV